jgi:hypothetical protein
MTRSGPEPWVCGSCRSLNQQSASRCYKCRTPRALVEADVNNLVVAGEGQSAAAAAVTESARAAALGGYKDSWARAGLTQCLLVGTGILAVLTSLGGADVLLTLVKGDVAQARKDVMVIGALGLVLWGFAFVSLLSWAAWLSRVVENVPKVGLGWPNVSPTAAFIENFLPGWNLLRVPAIVRDVVRRLEPNEGRGNALLAAAWLGLIGGVVMPRVAGFVVGFFVETLDQAVSWGIIIDQVALALTLVGLVFMVVLIRRIESKMEAASDKVAPAVPLTAAAQPTTT